MTSSFIRISLLSLTTLFTSSSVLTSSPNRPAQHDVPTMLTNDVDQLVDEIYLKELCKLTTGVALASGLSTLVSALLSNQKHMPQWLVGSLITWVFSTLAACKMAKALYIAEKLKRTIRERIVPVYGVI